MKICATLGPTPDCTNCVCIGHAYRVTTTLQKRSAQIEEMEMHVRVHNRELNLWTF